jgi:hypothetical protein
MSPVCKGRRDHQFMRRSRNRYAHLEALRRPYDTLDYSPRGEVEELVLEFLETHPEWWMRSRIAYALDVDINRLETVLRRLHRAGKVQLRINNFDRQEWVLNRSAASQVLSAPRGSRPQGAKLQRV